MSSGQVLDLFQPTKLLPPNLVIKGADSHLYAIGLSFYKSRSNVRRSRLRHPFIIFIYLILHFIRTNIILLTSQSTIEFHLYMGDVEFFLGSGSSIGMTVFIVTFMCVGCQAIHYYNYKHDIRPKDLVVLEMLAGLVSPADIGIRDRGQIASLTRIARIALKLTKLVNYDIALMTIFIDIIIFSQYATWLQMALIAIPQAISWGIWVHFVYCILNYHTVYFYLITLHLKNKVKSINSVLLFPWPRAKNVHDHLLNKLNNLLTEISECNDIFWSKYLFLIWTILGACISLMSFLVMVVGVDRLFIKILLTNYAIINSVVLLFLIVISSQIFSEVDKTYRLLNSLSTNQAMNYGILTKLKVLIHDIHVFINLSNFWTQIMSMVERLGCHRVGFYCWKLFIINSFRGYEVRHFSRLGQGSSTLGGQGVMTHIGRFILGGIRSLIFLRL